MLLSDMARISNDSLVSAISVPDDLESLSREVSRGRRTLVGPAAQRRINRPSAADDYPFFHSA